MGAHSGQPNVGPAGKETSSWEDSVQKQQHCGQYGSWLEPRVFEGACDICGKKTLTIVDSISVWCAPEVVLLLIVVIVLPFLREWFLWLNFSLSHTHSPSSHTHTHTHTHTHSPSCVQVSLLDWAVLFVKKDQGKATDFVNMLSKVCPPIGMEVGMFVHLLVGATRLWIGREICLNIRTHVSGSYVGMALWAWFLLERLKTLTKHCLYLSAHV